MYAFIKDLFDNNIFMIQFMTVMCDTELTSHLGNTGGVQLTSGQFHKVFHSYLKIPQSPGSVCDFDRLSILKD